MFGFFSKTTKPAPIKTEEAPQSFKPHSPIELKIKALSLTMEARIIKRLERKLKRRYPHHATDEINKKTGLPETIIHYGPSPLLNPKRASQFFLIQGHRKNEVRLEARATHLARAFLKGRPYHEVEQKALDVVCPLFKNHPVKLRIEALVKKYGQGDSRAIAQRFEEWCQNGQNYWDAYWAQEKAA